jgi:hypothetical protein
MSLAVRGSWAARSVLKRCLAGEKRISCTGNLICGWRKQQTEQTRIQIYLEN